MPPRRQPVGVRLDATRPERVAVAISFYADRVRVGDIVEFCRLSISTVMREALRAGFPIRSHGRERLTIPLSHLLTSARASEHPDAFRAETGVSGRTAAAVWYSVHGGTTPDFAQAEADGARILRRCEHCRAATPDPKVCGACGRSR